MTEFLIPAVTIYLLTLFIISSTIFKLITDINNHMNKIILTDADGVLLRWEQPFRAWMQAHNYIINDSGKNNYLLHNHFTNATPAETKLMARRFNESAAIGFLPPLRDSVQYVKKLHEEHGYKFRVITSLSTDKHAGMLREINLRHLYGDAIESVVCLDTGADKDQALEPYRDSGLFWIEDKFENFELGVKLGLKSILVEHGHNFAQDTTGGMRVKSWEEIYDIVISSSI